MDRYVPAFPFLALSSTPALPSRNGERARGRGGVFEEARRGDEEPRAAADVVMGGRAVTTTTAQSLLLSTSPRCVFLHLSRWMTIQLRFADLA